MTLEDLLDNLLFLNQESTDNALTDARRATRAAVRTGDRAMGLAHVLVFLGLQMLNALERLFTVTTLGTSSPFLQILSH